MVGKAGGRITTSTDLNLPVLQRETDNNRESARPQQVSVDVAMQGVDFVG
jgi:hypothetical protein